MTHHYRQRVARLKELDSHFNCDTEVNRAGFAGGSEP